MGSFVALDHFLTFSSLICIIPELCSKSLPFQNNMTYNHYSFTLLKNILWLSKQMNLMNSLPASLASYPVFSSLVTHIARPHIYIQFLEHIILFYYLSNGRYYRQMIFLKNNRLGTLYVEHIILFYNIFLFFLCYSSSWHP